MKAKAPTARRCLAKVLGLSSDEMKRYWLERQYASADQPPASVPDEASVVKFVSLLQGRHRLRQPQSALGKGEGVKVVLTVAF